MQKAAFYRVKGYLLQFIEYQSITDIIIQGMAETVPAAPAQAPTACVTCTPESGKARLAAVPGVLLSYLRPQMPAVKACLNER